MTTRMPILILSFLMIVSTGCLKDQCTETRTFVQFDPVYKTSAELSTVPTIGVPRPLRNPGILYVYQNFILINEFREGIHIIDNSNPANPVNTAFIEMEGNEHFAVSQNRLQGNKFNALVTLDISDMTNPKQTSRIEDVFGEIWEDGSRGFLVYYRETARTRTLDCSDRNFNAVRWQEGAFGGPIFVDQANFDVLSSTSRGEASIGAGTGGSTARFTITKNHLFTVSQSDLMVYNLANPSVPKFESRAGLGWGIETIYPFKDKLFIGSNSGMFIYDISNPGSPFMLSQFSHARACDPVVADDNTAYVTLREGSLCEWLYQSIGRH